MKIKVCGLREPGNIKAVADLSPDYVGFIFYHRSPRYIEAPIIGLANNVKSPIVKTGVFVNEQREKISELMELYDLGAIQLHGSESPEFCASFKGKVIVIKAFGMNEEFDFDQLLSYQSKVDYFLFDTKTALDGGSGKTFDWSILNNYKLNIPFFLSGGLSLDNLEEVKNIDHSQFYGVDLNSRFETGPAIKDIKKLEKAFEIIKHNISNELRS